MSWIVGFAGLVVLLVAVYVGMGLWGRLVERERHTAAQQAERQVFETWQEAPADEQDTPERRSVMDGLPSTGLIPIVLGGGVVLLAAVVLLRAWRERRRAHDRRERQLDSVYTAQERRRRGG